MPMVATGSGAIDVMSKLLQDRILMLNGQVPWGLAGKGVGSRSGGIWSNSCRFIQRVTIIVGNVHDIFLYAFYEYMIYIYIYINIYIYIYAYL